MTIHTSAAIAPSAIAIARIAAHGGLLRVGAGGLTGGLWAQYDAALEPGAAFVLDALGFDARMRAARAVIVGEGKIDEQTLQGKIAGEIATRARQAGVPCFAIVGTRELDAFGARMLDLQRVLEASDLDAIAAAAASLADVL